MENIKEIAWEDVYAFEAWEVSKNEIEFTLRTSNSIRDITFTVSKVQAELIVAMLYNAHPNWKQN